ncbi:MAG TPA: hypothetical protein VEU30_00670 [Thermoanaerobaculia bacterium]|nr:hypothetical protein [Thermoanaerobaculia bacterium]
MPLPLGIFGFFLVLLAGPEREVTPRAEGPAAFNQSNARIATDGDGFLAVWTNAEDVHATRLTADLRRAGDLVVAGGPEWETDPDVEWGGSRYLVAWRSGGIRGRFVAPDGTMSEPFGIAYGVGDDDPRIAFNGTHFLVVWTTRDTIRTRAALVDLNGTVQPAIDLGPAHEQTPRVIAHDGSFYVPTANMEVAVTRIDANGAVDAPRILATSDFHPIWRVLIGFDETGELVATWHTVVSMFTWRAGETTDLGRGYVQTLTGDTVVFLRDAQHFVRRIGSDAERSLELPLHDLVTGAAMQDGELVFVRQTEGDLYAHNESHAELLTVAPRHQDSPDIAAAGDVRVVVWAEHGTSYAVRIGNAAIDLGVNAPPRIASSGSDFLIVWKDGGSIYGRRMALDGTFIDAEPFVIAGNVFWDRDVTWDGAAYRVAFTRGRQDRGGFVRAEVFVARVQDGRAIDEVTVTAAAADHRQPVLAGAPAGTLVVWHESWWFRELRGALIAPNGAVIPLEFPDGDQMLGPAAVAANGETFVVAAQFVSEVRWWVVSKSGVVTMPPITSAAGIRPPDGTRGVQVVPWGERFLLLAQGYASFLGPVRMTATAPEQVTSDAMARIAGSTLAYVRPVDEAWPNITRLFVRDLSVAANSPRRRSVR